MRSESGRNWNVVETRAAALKNFWSAATRGSPPKTCAGHNSCRATANNGTDDRIAFSKWLEEESGIFLAALVSREEKNSTTVEKRVHVEMRMEYKKIKVIDASLSLSRAWTHQKKPRRGEGGMGQRDLRVRPTDQFRGGPLRWRPELRGEGGGASQQPRRLIHSTSWTKKQRQDWKKNRDWNSKLGVDKFMNSKQLDDRTSCGKNIFMKKTKIVASAVSRIKWWKGKQKTLIAFRRKKEKS